MKHPTIIENVIRTKEYILWLAMSVSIHPYGFIFGISFTIFVIITRNLFLKLESSKRKTEEKKS
jgi:uncharacterized membrane protein